MASGGRTAASAGAGDRPRREAVRHSRISSLTQIRALMRAVSQPHGQGAPASGPEPSNQGRGRGRTRRSVARHRPGGRARADLGQAWGGLTAGEWERVRLHAYYTDRALARCGLARVSEIASHHHERLDGSGYPRDQQSPSAAGRPSARCSGRLPPCWKRAPSARRSGPTTPAPRRAALSTQAVALCSVTP